MVDGEPEPQARCRHEGGCSGAPALYSARMASPTTQIHVLVGCSDARDVGRVHLEVVEQVRREYLARGVRSELFVLRTPGTFVTGDVLTDVRRVIESTQRHASPADAIEYFVHIQSHGELAIAGDEKYRCGLHQIEVERDSVFNCGMLAATRVAVDLERLVIELAPVVELANGRTLRVDCEQSVRRLLWERYGYDGYLAGDWVKSVDDLRTHTRLQKAVVERALRTDRDLRGLRVHVTAGIQDYRRNAYVRVDGGDPDGKFWDEGQRMINARFADLPADALDRVRQAEGQKPLVGLLAMSDIRASRAQALACFAELTGCPVQSYEPNTVFAMSGSAFDLPMGPLGPYAIAGLFYAVKCLGLRRVLVMGNDHAQTARMLQKVHNDPLASLVVRHFGVTLLPVLARELPGT